MEGVPLSEFINSADWVFTYDSINWGADLVSALGADPVASDIAGMDD